MKEVCKKYVCLSAVLLAAAALSGLADEQETKRPTMPRSMLELKKSGTVQVEKDAEGKATAIKLIVTSYEITLDEGSKPLESMDGQKVKVIGTYKKIGDEGWLTVTSIEPFLAVEKPAESAPDKPCEPAGEQPSETQKQPAEQAPEPPEAAGTAEECPEQPAQPAPEPTAPASSPAEQPAEAL